MSKLITCRMKYAQDEEVIAIGTIFMNKASAILLRSVNGEPIARATINVDHSHKLHNDEVVIKDYSENEGMYDTLFLAGIIVPTNLSINGNRVVRIIDQSILDDINTDLARVA
jgi:hypothetical protein